MKQVIGVLALCSLIGIASSCKKDKENKTTSGAISGFLVSHHIIADSTYFGSPIDAQEASAVFLSDPANQFSVTLVDSVFINDSPLEVDGDSIGFVGPQDSVDMNSTCNWRVKGNSFIPGFSFNFAATYPAISGSHPDTIDKTNGITFHYSFTGADSVIIRIASTQTGQTIDKTFPGNSTSQQFTAAELQSLVPSSQVGWTRLYTVHAMRSTDQVFGGKTFRFSKVLTWNHMAWIK